MDNGKTDEYYVGKITTDLIFIINHTDGLTMEQLEENEVLLDSVMFRLIQVSEKSDRLTADFKSRYSSIPWFAIKGLRNRIVHEYGNVDISVVYDTIKIDVPQLIAKLTNITWEK